MYGKPSILGEIKSSRLKWLGHIERREKVHYYIRYIKESQEEEDVPGDLGKTWLSDVEEDIRDLGEDVPRIGMIGLYLLRQALVLQGL